ncbi:MAG: DUF5777 family beta-barrel protein [Cyclobacteriaceae bacterium]
MHSLKYYFVLLLCQLPLLLYAQGGLLDELEEASEGTEAPTESTFKGTRIVNGQSVELWDDGALGFIISHRFGRLNGGAYEFFGLDDSNIRLGLEYGLTDFLNVGIGRNSFQKTYDGYLKLRVLQQQSGTRQIPVSIVAFSSMAINTLRNDEQNPPFSSRIDYTYQLLIARKFSSRLSLQVSPTLVHRNLVELRENPNNLYALGLGGRWKATSRVSLNAEYFLRLNAETEPLYNDAFALGVDIETGGHVFQLHLTNTQSMIEEGFITETTGDFFSGDIHFGFNISRVFQLK